MKLGEYLKLRRQYKGLTVDQAANEMKMFPQYLERIESGIIKKVPTSHILIFSEFYHVSYNHLISLTVDEYLNPAPQIQAKGTLISDFFSPEDVHKMYMDEMQRSRELSKEITAVRSWLFSSFGDYGTIDQILAGKGHIETDTAVKAVIFYLLNK